MLERNEIIKYLKEFSENKDYVYAMWLEGADGVDRVDEYSDIDFWFDVKKEYQESFLYECIDALSSLGEIDSRVDEVREEIAQSNIHLKNTSKYLTLDICVQSHKVRGREVTCFVRGDIAEVPQVLFDKNNIISYRECDVDMDMDEVKKIFLNSKNRIEQVSRVDKYIKRGNYLEAYSKYIDNICNPLVRLARLVYTPRHTGYLLCHISSHLPRDVVEELEEFYKVSGMDDISNNLSKAIILLEEFEKEIVKKYNL